MSAAGAWGLFALVVVAALAIDLGVFHRQPREMRMGQAGLWVGIWMALALAFNGYVVLRLGWPKGLEFTQGYLLEFALSTDNLFVFMLIFSYFRVARAYQHRILFWGIFGAVLTRGLFIAAGAAVVHHFRWVLYGFGAFLLYAAFKLVFRKETEVDPARSPALRLFRRLVRVAEDATGPEFIIRRDGKLWATPLLAVLIVVETVDVTFAVDSIPAIFGVTTDVFIVLTSNVFAILGLRSLYFLVSGLAQKLAYLNYGIAAVLAFIGAKIVLAPWLTIPVWLSLAIVFCVIALAVGASLLWPQRLASMRAPMTMATRLASLRVAPTSMDLMASSM
jgi:tellurite resistance protein TerC